MKKKRKLLLTGASGMIGSLVLTQALSDDSVGEIVSLVRKPSGIKHAKLKEIEVKDFMDYLPYADSFQGIDHVIYCLGVYTGAVPREAFRKITVDYPVRLAQAIYTASPQANFALLSGQGADRSEKSKLMFAKDKGAAENQLERIGFSAFYSFRPGYIYPVKKRKEPNFSYRLFRKLYPWLKNLSDNLGLSSEELARAMYRVTLEKSAGRILENQEIKSLGQ